MKVLVACEFSGIVRDAFAARGHDAYSCDLLPSETPGGHVQGDVLAAMDALPWLRDFDLMIAHPPCTYLSRVANHVWDNPGRAELREAAAEFFMALYNAPIPRICVENPVGHMNRVFRKPDQIIHPYYFGNNEMKRTCLWLKGLPKLLHPDPRGLKKPEPRRVSAGAKTMGKALYFNDTMPGGKDRAKNRSRTFKGIAKAMAEQWGGCSPETKTED